MEERTQGAPPRHLQLGVALGAALTAAGFFFDVDADCHDALIRDLSAAVLEGTLPDNPYEWFQQQIQHQLREWLIARTQESLGLLSPVEIKRLPQQQVFRRELMDTLYRASELVAAVHLSPAEVAAMLNQAGTPPPADPAGIIRLSEICLTIAMRHQHFLAIADAWERDKEIWREAREAQNKMRQLMPLVIGHSKLADGLDPTLQGGARKSPDDALQILGGNHRVRLSQRTKNYQRFTRELEKLDISNLEPPVEVSDSWHDHAADLAQAYGYFVNPRTGWSRSGPAVRFLQQALCRAYPGVKITAAAIELHLSRQRRS